VQVTPDSSQTSADLLTENEELRSRVEKLSAEREQYRELYLQMLELNKKLERGILGQKAEKLPADESQLTLQLLATLLKDGDKEQRNEKPEGEAHLQEVQSHKRRKPTGRKPLPEDLPRVDIEILPEEVKREGLDAFERIGEEVRETVERRPSSMVAVRVTRPKFVRKDRAVTSDARVLIADPIELPIERGVAGPGLLADSLVRRFQDHLPLNRLEGIYAREGLEMARSTLCSWHEQLADLARPLVEAMWEDGLSASPYLCTDATGVLVQAKERCRRGHFWVVVAPERHVLYQYSRKHDSKAVDRLLADYEGYLVADAHAVYDHLYADGKVVEVGCWAHCRRYFFKALSSDPERSRKALAYIRGLFDLERAQATAPRKKRQQAREEKSRPLVERFFTWCEAEWHSVLDDTPIAKAVRYALNQREALSRFLEDSRLPLHNNGSELALRRQAVGRKAWLFVGSDQGAEVNTTFVTLLASCQLHGIEPWSYLRDLLCLLPGWKKSDVLALSPLRWRETAEQEHTQKLLANNPIRPITLD
jgi:transposase